MISRKNVEFAKQIFTDRLGDDYVYGGTFDPFNIKAGADCSGLVTDELGALFFGTAMHWDREGLSTESYRYKDYGPQKVGPFDLVHVRSLSDIPVDAAAVINLHHQGAGGPQSHMNIRLDGMYMEESGSWGCCTDGKAIPSENSYWNDHWYVPGPIIEDGTAVTVTEPKDTLFADVSEFQVPVTDAYPYQVLSIRSNDGTHQDTNFAKNYAWCVNAANSGKLTCFIVYFYWRPNWQQAVQTHINMVHASGGPHPKMITMIDVERGGNPAGNFSDALNSTDDMLVQWLGDPKRVIAYANVGDANGMWPNHREDQFIIAGYGSNPSFPGKIAHQYTDGQGYGGGLPEGCAPFGNCDMNSADGLSPTQFAASCGISSTATSTNPTGGLSMADAQALLNNEAGVNQNGDPEAWRLVAARHERNVGDIVNDPNRQEWNSTHNGKSYPGTADAFEQMVVVAEQIGWKHTFSDGKVRDPGDILIELGEFLIAQVAIAKAAAG